MASKIKDGMFIGDQYVASDVDFIIANKVTHVINSASQEVSNFWSRIGIKYFEIEWPYDAQTNTYSNVYDDQDDMLRRLAEFVTSAQNQGESILIHSVTGQNRAPATVVALFMYMYGWGLHKVMDFLQSKRHTLQPCAPLLRQLVALDQKFSRQPPIHYANGHLSAEELKRRRHSWELAHPINLTNTTDGARVNAVVSRPNSSGGQLVVSSRNGGTMPMSRGGGGGVGEDTGVCITRPGTPAAKTDGAVTSATLTKFGVSTGNFKTKIIEPSVSFKRTQYDEVILHNTFVNSISVSDSFPYTSASSTTAGGRAAIHSPRRQPTIRWVDSPTRIQEGKDGGEDVMRSPFSKQPLPTRPPGPSYRSLKAGRGWVDADDTASNATSIMSTLALPVSAISFGSSENSNENSSSSPRSPVPGVDCELRPILRVRGNGVDKSVSGGYVAASGKQKKVSGGGKSQNSSANKTGKPQTPPKPNASVPAINKTKKGKPQNRLGSWTNIFEEHREELNTITMHNIKSAEPSVSTGNTDSSIVGSASVLEEPIRRGNSNNYDAESSYGSRDAVSSVGGDKNRLFTMSTSPTPGREAGFKNTSISFSGAHTDDQSQMRVPRAAGSAAGAAMLLSRKAAVQTSSGSVLDVSDMNSAVTEVSGTNRSVPTNIEPWVRPTTGESTTIARPENGMRRGERRGSNDITSTESRSDIRSDRRHHRQQRGKSSKHLRSLTNGSSASSLRKPNRNSLSNNRQVIKRHHNTLSFQNNKKHGVNGLMRAQLTRPMTTGEDSMRRQASSPLLSDPRSSSFSKLSALSSSSSSPLLTSFHDALGNAQLQSSGVDRNGMSMNQHHAGNNNNKNNNSAKNFHNNLIAGSKNVVLIGQHTKTFEQRASGGSWAEVKQRAKLSMRPASAFIEDNSCGSNTLMVKSRRRPASSDNRLRANSSIEGLMLGVDSTTGSSRPRWR